MLLFSSRFFVSGRFRLVFLSSPNRFSLVFFPAPTFCSGLSSSSSYLTAPRIPPDLRRTKKVRAESEEPKALWQGLEGIAW